MKKTGLIILLCVLLKISNGHEDRHINGRESRQYFHENYKSNHYLNFNSSLTPLKSNTTESSITSTILDTTNGRNSIQNGERLDFNCSQNSDCTYKNSICINEQCYCNEAFPNKNDTTKTCYNDISAKDIYEDCVSNKDCDWFRSVCYRNICTCRPPFLRKDFFNRRCSLYGGLLDSCERNAECRENLVCINNTCAMYKSALGEFCLHHTSCSPFYCVNHHCTLRNGLQGEACMEDIQCTGNLRCRNWRCQSTLKKGLLNDYCDFDLKCSAGLSCVNNYCSPSDGFEGHKCETSLHCISGLLCIRGKCHLLPEENDEKFWTIFWGLGICTVFLINCIVIIEISKRFKKRNSRLQRMNNMVADNPPVYYDPSGGGSTPLCPNPPKYEAAVYSKQKLSQ